MADKSEQVKQLIANFMDLHKDNLSIAQIANKYGVTPRTVYRHLQEIADLNNVDRDSLLTVPHKVHETSSTFQKAHQNIDPLELQKDFVKAISLGNELISKIDNIIKEV